MVDMVHSAEDNVATPGSLAPTESAILGPMYLDNPTEGQQSTIMPMCASSDLPKSQSRMGSPLWPERTIE